MPTWIKNNQTPSQGLRRAALKQVLLGHLIFFLSVGWGDRAFAQATSDSVLDRIPESVAVVVSDQGSNLFLARILYAGAVIWIISLMGSGKD